MENLGLSPLPNGTVRLFSEYKSKDLAYVGGTETKYVPIGDRVEVNVGPDKDITIHRRLKDQKIGNVVVRQYKRRLDDQFVLYYDLVDYDETFFYEEELVSGKPVRGQDRSRAAVRRQRGAVGLGRRSPRAGRATSRGPTSICTQVAGRVERVDQQHVKYFLDLQPGKKQTCQLQRDVQAAEGGAGAEHRAEAGAALMGFCGDTKEKHWDSFFWKASKPCGSS